MTTPSQRAEKAAAFPLSHFTSGQDARVSRIEGGVGLTQRLAALGIVPGRDLHILRRGHGPMIVRVGHSRLLLGRGMTHHILAEAVPQPPVRGGKAAGT